MNRFFATIATATFCLLASVSAFALTSVCNSFDSVRMASHTVNLNWYESTIVNSLEWESDLVGPSTLSLDDTVRNVTYVALHVFNTLPYGSYSLTGVARLYTVELGEWEQYSGSRCYIVFDFPEPEECPGDPMYSNERLFSAEIQRDLQDSIGGRVRNWPLECSSEGTISVSGDIRSFEMSQECCDVTRYNQYNSGSVTLNLSGITCSTSTPSIPIPQMGSNVKATFSISAGGSGSINADAPDDLCEDYRLGTISAGFDGNVDFTAAGVLSVLPPLDVATVTVTGTGSTEFSLTVNAINLSNVTASGCFGPLIASGSIRVDLPGNVLDTDVPFNKITLPNTNQCFG